MSPRAPRPARVYAGGVRGRIGKNGEVPIPKALLRVVGLSAGDAIRLSLEGAIIRIEPSVSPDQLMGRLAGYQLLAVFDHDRQPKRNR